MPKYKTQTNDLTEIIETGTGGSGGLTYETVDLGNINTSTGAFDTVSEASKEKIINIFKNKKLVYLRIIVNNYFISGSPKFSHDPTFYTCLLFDSDKTMLTLQGSKTSNLRISLELTLSVFIVANANYTLVLGYDN